MSLNKDLRIANELENTIVMQPQVIQQDLDLFQPQQQQVNAQVHEHKNVHKGHFEPTKFMERLQARNSIKKFKVKSVPEKSALLKAYKGKAVNISAEVRAQKIKNKRSRLFVKAKNSDACLKAHNDILAHLPGAHGNACRKDLSGAYGQSDVQRYRGSTGRREKAYNEAVNELFPARTGAYHCSTSPFSVFD